MWIHSCDDGLLASYSPPRHPVAADGLEGTLTSASAALAMGSVAPNATIAK